MYDVAMLSLWHICDICVSVIYGWTIRFNAKVGKLNVFVFFSSLVFAEIYVFTKLAGSDDTFNYYFWRAQAMI